VTLDESTPVSTSELLEMAGEAEELIGRPVDFVLRPSQTLISLVRRIVDSCHLITLSPRPIKYRLASHICAYGFLFKAPPPSNFSFFIEGFERAFVCRVSGRLDYHCKVRSGSGLFGRVLHMNARI
jgi:hypothetical protein